MRSKRDNDEVKREYDFSGGVRGRFTLPHKVAVSVRLDNDVLLTIKKIAGSRKIRCQTLPNSLLQDYMQKGGLE